jgi:hypothetical protein
MKRVFVIYLIMAVVLAPGIAHAEQPVESD